MEKEVKRFLTELSKKSIRRSRAIEIFGDEAAWHYAVENFIEDCMIKDEKSKISDDEDYLMRISAHGKYTLERIKAEESDRRIKDKIPMVVAIISLVVSTVTGVLAIIF